jgi:endoglucanase
MIIKLLGIILFLLSFSYQAQGESNFNKIEFWNSVKKGTNIFNKEIRRQDIKAAKQYGMEFIRLAPDKFISQDKDFLIGDADQYTKLNVEDLITFTKILDICYEEQMPVVVTMLSLPGSRWRQNNNFIDDLRIWQNSEFQKQAMQFWQDLLVKIKDHPALIGINILNEPHPEKLLSSPPLNNSNEAIQIQQNLFTFYNKIINKIRNIDPFIPIIIDSSDHADPSTFFSLIPHDDPYILYSFHMYTPYSYTNLKQNNGRFTYPDKILNTDWDKSSLYQYLQPVLAFQKKYNIPATRILVGEFGAHRFSKGIENYFQDLISIFKEQNWHFAFYAFREDTWDGMDYELGNKKLPYKYWQDIEKGFGPYQTLDNVRTPKNSIFRILGFAR